MAIPTLVALRDIWPFLTLPLSVCALGTVLVGSFSALATHFGPRLPKSIYPALFLIGMCLFMLAHAAARGALTIENIFGPLILVLAASAVGLTALSSSDRHRELIQIALDSLALLIVTSTVLHLLGFEPAKISGKEGGSTTLLYRYGFDLLRSDMPLTAGPTTHAGLSGAVFIYAAATIASPLTKPWRKAWLFLSAGCALFGMIVSDGRTAIFSMFVVLACAWAIPTRHVRKAAYILPFSALLFIAALSAIPESLASALSRSGSAAEITTGNQRLELWSIVLSHFLHNPFSGLFGYGHMGQGASGLANAYAFTFSSWKNENLLYSTHNAGLQLLVDGGVIALLVFTWFYRSALSCFAYEYRAAGNPLDQAATWVLLFVLLVGMTDTAGTMVYRNLLYATILLGTAMTLARLTREKRWPLERPCRRRR